MFSELSMEIQWMFSGFSIHLRLAQLSKIISLWVSAKSIIYHIPSISHMSYDHKDIKRPALDLSLWPYGWSPFLQPISVEPHSNAIKSHSTTLKSHEVPLNHHKPPLNKLKSHEVPLNHHKPLKSYLSSIVFPNKSTIFFPGRLCKRPLGRLRPLGWLRPAGSAGEVLRSGRADFNDENIAWYLWKMACLAMMYNHKINMKQYEQNGITCETWWRNMIWTWWFGNAQVGFHL